MLNRLSHAGAPWAVVLFSRRWEAREAEGRWGWRREGRRVLLPGTQRNRRAQDKVPGKLRECLQVGTAAHHQVLLWGHQLSQAHSFPLLPWLPSTCPVIRVALGVPAWLTVPSPGLQGWVCRGTPLGQTHPLGSKTWPPPLGPGPRLHLLPLPALSGTVVFLSLQVPAAASSPGSLWNPPRCAPARRAPTWRHPSSSQTLTPPRICSDPYTDELLKMQIPGNHQHHWPCSMHAVQPRARTRS